MHCLVNHHIIVIDSWGIAMQHIRTNYSSSIQAFLVVSAMLVLALAGVVYQSAGAQSSTMQPSSTYSYPQSAPTQQTPSAQPTAQAQKPAAAPAPTTTPTKLPATGSTDVPLQLLAFALLAIACVAYLRSRHLRRLLFLSF